MDRETAKEMVLGKEPDFLEPAKQKVNGHTSYICPNPSCGNGSGKDGTGIARVPKGRKVRYKCFVCGLYEDVIGLWKLHRGIEDNTEAFNSLYEYYGIQIDSKPTAQEDFRESTKSKPKMNDTQKNIHTNTYTQADTSNNMGYYRECQKHITETDYPAQRGLSADLVQRYMLGYDSHYKTVEEDEDGNRSYTAWKALIIPTGSNSYVARNMNPEATKKNRYRKRGTSLLFNTKEALGQDTQPVFIVEGELDALSIIEVGGQAVGLGSTANYKQLIERLQTKKPEKPLILALDNDEDGTSTTETLEKELKGLGVSYIVASLYGDQKDANSLLVKDRGALQEGVRRAVENALSQLEEDLEAQKEEYLKTSVASHLQEFINGIAESVNTPYTPTGFEKLDEVLDGGLYEGLYIVGAISSLGKTTLITQLGDQVAESGGDVLIFSLEMARSELMSKSISRLTLLDTLQNNGNTRDAKTARGITTGSRYTNYSKAETELIQRAITAYGGYADHIYIHEGVGDIGTDQIREQVKAHILFTGRRPTVIVDYLQILAPADVRATDKQNTDKAVLELKRISRDYKIPVIGISSFNRANYREAVTMEAFKESGAIEYSSDVLIGLQLKGAGGKDFNANEAKVKNPREVELVILKNRNGATGKKVAFEYYPLFNYFKEV